MSAVRPSRLIGGQCSTVRIPMEMKKVMRRRKSPDVAPTRPPVAILSVSPSPEDHDVLQRILQKSDWKIQAASTFCLARQLVREQGLTGIICEADLSPNAWKDLLAEALSLPQPPFFIVVSADTDPHLCAEVLNMGAYDILIKPLQAAEVIRALDVAVAHWQYRREAAASRKSLRTAAGAN